MKDIETYNTVVQLERRLIQLSENPHPFSLAYQADIKHLIAKFSEEANKLLERS